MIIYPAIDIKGGQAVRLKKGDFNRLKVYFNDPADAAKKWIKAGTKVLHIVDLDGAKEGHLINVEPIKKIVALGVDIQLGGGLRNLDAIKTAFEIGVKRAVIGTALIKDRSLAKNACREFGAENIIAGIDLKENQVAVEGWQEGAQIGYRILLEQMKNVGVQNLIVTDINKDGMLTGPNIPLMKELVNKWNFKVIASGGVCALDELIKLKKIGMAGAIIGTALYEGKINLSKALKGLDNAN